MEKELKNARTMREILEIVSKEYDLNQPLGIATKAVVITGLGKVLKLINAKKHEAHNKTPNF